LKSCTWTNKKVGSRIDQEPARGEAREVGQAAIVRGSADRTKQALPFWYRKNSSFFRADATKQSKIQSDSQGCVFVAPRGSLYLESRDDSSIRGGLSDATDSYARPECKHLRCFAPSKKRKRNTVLLPFPFRGPCSSSPTDGLPTTATRLNPNPRFFWANRGGVGEDVGEAGALEHSQEPQGEDPLPPSPAPSHLAVAARLTGALSAAPQFMQRAAAAQKAEVEVEAAAQVVAATDGGSGPSPQVRRKWYGDRKSRFFLLPLLLV
jgi:hypothetical protein